MAAIGNQLRHDAVQRYPRSGHHCRRHHDLGFMGSGNIGGTVARLTVEAGHELVPSNSRDTRGASE